MHGLDGCIFLENGVQILTAIQQNFRMNVVSFSNEFADARINKNRQLCDVVPLSGGGVRIYNRFEAIVESSVKWSGGKISFVKGHVRD